MPNPNIMEALLRMQQLPGVVMPDYHVSTPDPNQEQIDPSALFRDMQDGRTKSQLAQAMIGQGYIPNSGKLGILAQALSAFVGAKMQRGADEKLSDVMSRQFKMQQQGAEAAHAEKLAEEDRKFQRQVDLERQKGEMAKANRPAQVLSPGAAMVGSDGKPIYQNPFKPDKPEGPTANARDFAMYQRLSPEQRAQWDAMQGRQPAAAGGEAGLTGDAFLQSLPPGQAQLIKAIAEGRQAMPNARSKEGIAIARAVQQYDPNADATTIKGRMDTQHSFSASGDSGKSIKALDQVASHIDALHSAMDGLGNTGSPAVNAAKNWVSGQLGGAGTTEFATKANAVGEELEKAWRGTGGSVEGIKAWRSQLSPNMNPAQQQAALSALGDLLSGADEALRQSYARGMRLNDQPQSFLDAKTQAVIAKLKGLSGQAQPAPAATPALDPLIAKYLQQ